jgi:hypothetical protein
MEDVEKWALKEENRAIQDCSQKMKEIFELWTDAQHHFVECVEELRHNFKMILEGEQGIANAKADLDTSENRESKLVKELKKLNKKAHNSSSSLSHDQQQQLNDIKDKLEQSTREKELAKIEVSDKIREQEAVKMIRFKSGFNKLVVGYLDLAEKGNICFTGGHEIIETFPDVESSDIHTLRYSGSATTLIATEKAKERMKHFRSNVSKSRSQPVSVSAQCNGPHSPPTAPINDSISCSNNVDNPQTHYQSTPTERSSTSDLPPPYTEVQPPINPYFNTAGSTNGNIPTEMNGTQQNSSYNTSTVNCNSNINTNNNSNLLNDSQTLNSNDIAYNRSSSYNSPANVSTLSQSSSFLQSPSNNNSNLNTSHRSGQFQPRSLYPSLNTSLSSNNVSQTDNSTSFPTPDPRQHVNELRHSVNRLSLGNDQF